MAFAKIPPMTSRQAKKAYRQAGGVRLSAVEQKRMERKAVLLEREQKAKEKEKSKIANKKKRLEKEEKAKEQRKSTGITEEGYVSPRQVRLAAYFGKVRGQDGDAECSKEENPPVNDYCLPSPCLKESVTGENPRNNVAGISSYLPQSELSFSESDWASFLPSNTQVEREISGIITIAKTSTMIEDTIQLASRRSEQIASQKATTTAGQLQSNTSLHQEDLAQIPPFSTQDLGFSTDELTELMSPAKIPEALLAIKSASSSRQLQVSSSANKRAHSGSHADYIDNEKGGTSTEEPPTTLATPVNQIMVSCHSENTSSSKCAIASKSPGPTDHENRPSTYPKVTKSSTRKSYVLGDREVVPGHAKYVLDRMTKTTLTKKTSRKVFGNPMTNSMRPPNKKPLGDSNGNPVRIPRNKLMVTSSKDESIDTIQQCGENRHPNDLQTASAALDFGDSFLSTQELLDYIV
ncbi:hypothetical protein MMC11_001820 [Xylographa trunciseda]|nr:hypothetical protein [Xylographa trunciseda]